MNLYDLTQRTFRDVLLVRAVVLKMQSCGQMTLSRLPPGHFAPQLAAALLIIV